MVYSIEPAYSIKNELTRIIIKAGTEPINKWFFTDGAFSPEFQLENIANTWNHENFAVICNNEILGYFEAGWNKPLNIITTFRLIVFNKKKSFIVAKAFFQYLDYLFIARGANSINWTVALKNTHALKIYTKFIKKNCGHIVGDRHFGQMAYDGEVSDIRLFELTKTEYLMWRKHHSL